MRTLKRTRDTGKIMVCTLLSITTITIVVVTIIVNVDPGFPIYQFYLDGILLHKFGELLMVSGFIVPLLLTQVYDKKYVKRFLFPSYSIVIVGGAFNLIAWGSLKNHYYWHPWCIVLFIIGVFSYKLILKLIEKQY